ncbi:MAG TPA: DUF1361 domain-containing protein, partial [Ktedonobacteraceae bacterium]|nr:DUF1361 domain-containing protein [Ktedonobacteraceae bacterium]
GLYAVGVMANHDAAFNYLISNLFLAWIPLFLALWLRKLLQMQLWSSWLALAVTIAWMAFLPNSFYMISDFVHVQEVQRVDLLYDIVMFSSFILNGLIVGYMSLYIVHVELVQRLRRRTAASIVAGVLLLCSFAIYIGRDLRWNTWDILVQPAALLIDVSDRFLNPHEHPQALTTTVSFFVLLSSLYAVIWTVGRTVRLQKLDETDTPERPGDR